MAQQVLWKKEVSDFFYIIIHPEFAALRFCMEPPEPRIFRILQGIGGGALQPISQSILLETFPQRQHGMAMAIFGVGIMFGPIIGPLLGGWITDNWSWHWIFFINIPIGIVSILMVIFL